MLQVNDINLKLKIDGYGATHYRITTGNDLNVAPWLLINEDYIIEFELPNIEGEYVIQLQLKNPYNESEVMMFDVSYYEYVDTELPSTVDNIVASNIEETNFDLTWNPSSDNDIVLYYRIYLNDVLVSTTTETNISLTGLNQNTRYDVCITAVDKTNNESVKNTPVVVNTLMGELPNTLINNVIIAQVFSPSSTVVNTQDGVTVDHCFITLYNKSDTAVNLSNAKLYWKYDAYPQWIKTNLTGIIQPKKHFLIRGSKLTGVVPGTNILVDWSICVPDLDCSVNWNNFVDPNPDDVINVSDRMVQWGISQNLFYVASKTGVIYLSDKEVDSLPENPWLVKNTLPDYVDMVGLLGNDGVNTIGETTPINGVKKSLILNRKQLNNEYIDTDNNSADFASQTTLLASGIEISALIKSSRT